MKLHLSFLAVLLLTLGLKAENGCEITVKLEYYHYDTLWFGTTYGKRAEPQFFALKQADETYLLKTEGPLEEGMYAILYKRGAGAGFQYFQCWIKDGQRRFSISTHISIPYEKPTITGSTENEYLFSYLKQLSALDRKMDEATERDRIFQNEKAFRERVQVEAEMRKMQEEFIKHTPKGPTTKLIEQTLFPTPPEAGANKNWKAEANDRWKYQRAHFFDNMDIATPDFLRYLQWLDRTDFFLFNLPPAEPDTAKALIDLVFKRLEAYPDGHKYYQKYVVNSLAKMSKFQLDEVYVYVVKKYMIEGKPAWANANDIRNATNNAQQMEKLFVGMPSPSVTLFDRDNNPVKLYDIQAKITLLIFFMPDCGHCKKEIPAIAKLYEKYKEKGLKVVTVCLKTMGDAPQCWEFADNNQLPKDWYSLADPNRQANLSPQFNIKSFPRLFLLDADKKIRYKRSGETPDWQMEVLLDRLLGE